MKRSDANRKGAARTGLLQTVQALFSPSRISFDRFILAVDPHRRHLELAIKTRVQKWGNSLALRIPKTFAEEAGLRANGTVELSLVDGKLVAEAIVPQPLTLDELLRGVTKDNLPGEWNTGPATGKEVW